MSVDPSQCNRKRKLLDEEEDDDEEEEDAEMLLALSNVKNTATTSSTAFELCGDTEMPPAVDPEEEEEARRPSSPQVPPTGPLPERLDALTCKLQRMLSTPSDHFLRASHHRRTTGKCAAAHPTEAPPDPTAAHTGLVELLRTHHTSRADWTHLWAEEDGCTVPTRIVEPRSAAELYTLAAYDRSGMALLERRLANVARLAVCVEFRSPIVVDADVDPVPAFECLVRFLDAFVGTVCVPDLRIEPIDRACALVVRTPDPAVVHVHFPGIAVSVEHMSAAWFQWATDAVETSGVGALRPLNAATRRPMFCDTDTLWMVYDPAARCAHPDPLSWLAANSARLSPLFHLGRSEPFPAGASVRTVQRVLPMLLSINPMGTPLFLSQRQTESAAALLGWCVDEVFASTASSPSPPSELIVQKALSLHTYLRHLAVTRRHNPVLQNEVGMLLYAAMPSDQYHAFRLWVLWIHGHLNQAINQQTYCELLQQWRSFGHHNGTVSSAAHAEIRLHAMVEADCDAAQWTLFLNEMRALDHHMRNVETAHSDRPTPSQILCMDTLKTMGSMTHMDIARWAFHALRGRVCCSSTVGRGMWYLYAPDKHRWVFDRDGPNVLLEAFRIVRKHLLAMSSVSLDPPSEEATAPRAPAGGSSSSSNPNNDNNQGQTARRGPSDVRRPFPFIVNFPKDTAPENLHRAIVVHLDQCIGDVRQIQAILRALAVMTHNADFTSQLDVCNEHILPFGNGVLDMRELRLRPGRPDDMVSRGPSYHYVDHAADDDDVLHLERLLTTLFPDRELRQFILDFGATLLRKRNRFKHMYIFTGNTNGGKSLFMSLLNAAFDSLYGVLPVTALTGRQNDPSSQNDYLARTHGMSFCVCHEPDSTTQQIYPDVMKVMTSDTDRLTVRGLYESVREMVITWKLGLVCNWPPVFVNLDNATRERCKFIPFGSTFTDAANPLLAEQFRSQRFKADRSLTSERMASYARTLMCMFFTTYVRRSMSSPTYVLHVPPRIHMEADVYLKEICDFQMWVRGFFLPASVNEGEPMQSVVHDYLRQAMEVILPFRRLRVAAGGTDRRNPARGRPPIPAGATYRGACCRDA